MNWKQSKCYFCYCDKVPRQKMTQGTEGLFQITVPLQFILTGKSKRQGLKTVCHIQTTARSLGKEIHAMFLLISHSLLHSPKLKPREWLPPWWVTSSYINEHRTTPHRHVQKPADLGKPTQTLSFHQENHQNNAVGSFELSAFDSSEVCSEGITRMPV